MKTSYKIRTSALQTNRNRIEDDPGYYVRTNKKRYNKVKKNGDYHIYFGTPRKDLIKMSDDEFVIELIKKISLFNEDLI